MGEQNQSKAQIINPDSIHAQRYSVLGQIWAHHNQTQLQWPVVAVGVILVGLGTLISSTGSYPRIVGLFSFFAALITFAMVRTMRRAREIMEKVATEISEYDACTLELPVDQQFSCLNHPGKTPKDRGISGPLVLAVFLFVMIVVTGIAGLWLIVRDISGLLPIIQRIWRAGLIEISLTLIAAGVLFVTFVLPEIRKVFHAYRTPNSPAGKQSTQAAAGKS